MRFLSAIARCLTLLALLISASPAHAAGQSLCCPGDLDGDGSVAAADLGMLLGAWGPVPEEEPADLDGSGAVDASDLAVLLGAWGVCPAPCLKTLVVGTVELVDGTPVSQAVLVTELGGNGVSGPDGAFSFEVEVGQQASTLNVTAVASIRGVTYTGTKLVSSIALDGVTDAGSIVVSAEAGCSGAFGWLPGFGLPGMNGSVRALTVFDDGLGGGPALYAGGQFTMASGVTVNKIAKWNGTSWSSVGTGSTNGVNNTVFALTVFDDGSGDGPALYAGGEFTFAGGVLANRIAKWNGTAWSSLGTGSANGVGGVGAMVQALTVYDDGSGGGPALYAGGFFTTAGGVPASFIAKWNGTSWSSLGTGSANGVFGPLPYVYALTVFDDGSGGGPALYVGGSFTTAGGLPANRIAKWNGVSWSPLTAGSTNGVNDWVRVLTVFDDGLGGGPALYVGGKFTMAGDVIAKGIARVEWHLVVTTRNGLGERRERCSLSRDLCLDCLR
jgi:trimeric autotransporter adhesin